MPSNAPTSEKGVVTNLIPLPGSIPMSWAAFPPDIEAEKTPKLRWPLSVTETYPAMLNDSQIEALRAGTTLPLKRRRWQIDPNGADPRIVEQVSADLGLPIVGEDAKPRVVRQDRFGFGQHLHHVLLAPFYGHYYFAQWAPIDPRDGLAHLRNLLPLPPHTIMEIKTDDGGGLEWVRQWQSRNLVLDQYGRPAPIPVSGLAVYVWEQEAGNWLGRSMLRACYRDWLAKDDLIRGNLTKMRRNGMGIPTARQTDQSATGQALKDATRIAQAWRVGDEAAVGLPYGTDITLKGVEGSIPDHVPSIKLHDEAMARAFLAMFLQLGQTERGARALGETFVDFFAYRLDALAEWVCETTNLHVIRDLVDWNYGPDVDLIPLLVSERNEDPELVVSDMVALINSKALTVDQDLEDYLRARYRLPEGTRTPEQGQGTAAARAGGRASKRPFRVSASTDPAPFSREPLPHEAFVDWTSLRDAIAAARDWLVGLWAQIRGHQIGELVGQVADATSLERMAAIQASPEGAELIATVMHDLADTGASAVVSEMAAQGVTITPPDLTTVKADLTDRAAVIAGTMAASLTETAAREAVRIAGSALAPEDVATGVAEHLGSLTDAFLTDQLGGAAMAGMNAGRFHTMLSLPDGTRWYGSALMDTHTCIPCADDDGQEFASLSDLLQTYPVGGNKDCLGRWRCRCTGVAVSPDEAPASVL
jgi:hypothetical protein